MQTPQTLRQIRNALFSVTCVLAVAAALLLAASWRSRPEVDLQSSFSHIRIRRDGNVRTLIFVRDDGHEAVESRVDLDSPHELLLPYSRAMFASYLYRSRPSRVLIVGLGGGAMVHFLQRYDPDLIVDVVEIDPVVVRLAEEYFRVRSEGTINVLTTDGFQYLQHSQQQYDVIYMDAFLRPSEETDKTGVPSQLKTRGFYATLRERLTPGGIVVFNLNRHRGTEQDIETIEQSFTHATVFQCPPANNLVVVAATTDEVDSDDTLMSVARDLDERFSASFSFRKLLSNRR